MTVAVVIKEGPRDDWVLQTWAVNEDVGESCARFTCEQEGGCGNRHFEAKVLSEKDYDGKRLRVAGLFHYRAADYPIYVPAPRLVPKPMNQPKPLPFRPNRPAPLKVRIAPAPTPRMKVRIKP